MMEHIRENASKKSSYLIKMGICFGCWILRLNSALFSEIQSRLTISVNM